MKRNKQPRKPDVILTGDWHLREDLPICRTDDYWEAQWKKVSFIKDLQKEYGCLVIHSGDLFNHWKPSPYLLSKTIEHLPDQFCTIYGNHDLPQHNVDMAYKNGISTLEFAGKLTVLSSCHWGHTPVALSDPSGSMLVWHVMVYQGKKPWPGCVDPSARSLLRKYPWKLVLTGHNHKPFVEEYEGRLLVNPGSITRMDADQIDHKPRVYLWYADDNTVQPVYLPIESGVITREHITRTEERNDRIDAFISKLDTEWEASISFEENLERFAKSNNVRQSVMDIIIKAIE